jgi:hypothetical protein
MGFASLHPSYKNEKAGGDDRIRLPDVSCNERAYFRLSIAT